MQEVSKRILDLISELGIPFKIADRDSTDSWMWNGTDLARTKCEGRTLRSDEILHEICHWLVADPDAREFPEFGLIPGIVDPYAWGSASDGFASYDAKMYYGNGFFTMEENTTQEIATQMLSIVLGLKYSIKFNWPGLDMVTNWSQYLNFKFDSEWTDSDFPEQCKIHALSRAKLVLKEFNLENLILPIEIKLM